MNFKKLIIIKGFERKKNTTKLDFSYVCTCMYLYIVYDCAKYRSRVRL